LLHPLQIGNEFLPQYASVVGSGNEQNSNIAVLVDAIFIEDVTYTLADHRTRNQTNPGMGKAQLLEGGNVLAISFDSSSRYEKYPGASNIASGMATKDVENILGRPTLIADLGAKQIYLFRRLKVTFLDGKVSDVQ